MEILKIENLRAYYITSLYGVERRVRAVDNVSLEVMENEILGIAGESGCGKSTLLKTMIGLIKPPLTILGGKITYKFDGKDIDIVSQKEEINNLRWKVFSYVPQGSMSVLNPTRKIIKTFEDLLKVHLKIEGKEEIKKLSEEHLKALGLPSEVLTSYPHQLSGGMRQRVTIALSTLLKPKVIIADEATTALDVVVQRGVIQLLKRIQSEFKNSIIIVTHDMGVHANIADRIVIMYAGKILEVGSAKDIFKNPLHPYTKYLIDSLPKIGDKTFKKSVPGAPPSLLNPPTGCRFHPRCGMAMEVCKENVPALIDVGSGHKVACFLYSKEAEIS
ncbi:ABC transporter ATP-binding protein [Dictyoglomus thermophilum]|uniref:Oligopeptide ABC transporter, ATP-binding protein n=2 Tax=Dictyoglomus thermophilum TaxID=14 RepID=B5YBS7_DICT6|nr:ABC transporter ATP-binding protein [Dictyoglomus thermophilum]ACI19986.1 oligopeptide ABC transporter, ATP-binding protein [Dictyoglomus thermophilum H-6-12]MCX7720733.1 ABC transporter ATP-binding protein [Dictyoglomus thermophilum]TYT24131.1 ABC transporter ATP-binding protein [Dictyoglomus thermophilum]